MIPALIPVLGVEFAVSAKILNPFVRDGQPYTDTYPMWSVSLFAGKGAGVPGRLQKYGKRCNGNMPVGDFLTM